MNIVGLVLTIERDSTTGRTMCSLGMYENDIEIVLGVKFWTSKVEMNQVLFISGVIQRDSQSNQLWIDCSEFTAFANVKEGMVLSSFLSIHGVVNGTVISSNCWHGKDLGMSGNFQTKFVRRANDPRPSPAEGTKAVLVGKIVMMESQNLIVEVSNFDFCKSIEGDTVKTEGTPVKRVRLGKTLPSTPLTPIVLKVPKK